MSVKVDIKLNIPLFTKKLVNRINYEAALTTKAFAKRKVAVDQGTLKNSIEIFPDVPDQESYSVGSDQEHAAAQEYGRPDLPRYRFTPYLRPASKEALSPKNLVVYIRNALRFALSGSRK